MGKIMRVYLCGQDWTESHEEMYMDLPATPWELVDALEKLNLACEGDLYLQAEEYYDFDYIQGFIPESTSLSRLNELCAVLDSMDEQDRIGFRGLLQSSAFFDRFNLGFDRLMDLALAKDCYHIAADVGSDEQLGRFLCRNGFVCKQLELRIIETPGYYKEQHGNIDSTYYRDKHQPFRWNSRTVHKILNDQVYIQSNASHWIRHGAGDERAGDETL